MPKSTSRARPDLTEAQLREAIYLFESGLFHGSDLARRYGLKEDTMRRRLRAAGAVKGRIVHLGQQRLNAEIDARRNLEKARRWENQGRRLDLFITSGEDVNAFMRALLAADRAGELAAFGRAIRAC